jgi:hypothetical protein
MSWRKYYCEREFLKTSRFGVGQGLNARGCITDELCGGLPSAAAEVMQLIESPDRQLVVDQGCSNVRCNFPEIVI